MSKPSSSSTGTDGTSGPPTGGAWAGPPRSFSAMPMSVNCPLCKKTVITQVSPTCGCMTWTTFLALLFIGCCCFAFFGDCTKDMHHHCPNCGHFFGAYNRFSFGN